MEMDLDVASNTKFFQKAMIRGMYQVVIYVWLQLISYKKRQVFLFYYGLLTNWMD